MERTFDENGRFYYEYFIYENPTSNLIDDSVDINIFNPSSIGEYYLVNQIKEYWNIKYKLY